VGIRSDPLIDGSVTIETIDDIAVVTLSRPQVRNAVDAATARALHAAFVAFDDDPALKVAVFHGAHGHFCAGWDLQAGATSDPQAIAAALDFGSADPRPPGPMGPTRLLLGKPVMAAVEGAAVAGGMELALWCDLRVMAEDAYFGIYCRRFGVPLIDGGTVRLPRLIGLSRALDLILTGRRVDAAEALAMGLANRVVPPGQARAAAIELARQLARFPQATLRADRLSALGAFDASLPEALLAEWRRGRDCIPDAVAGATRFAGGEGRGGRF